MAGALGWTYAATLGIALVYLGEHYVVDLAAGLALAESIRAATPIATPFATQLSSDAAGARAQGAGMTRAPEQTVDEPRPGDAHEDDDRGLEFSGRSVLTLCGFLAAMILGLYLLLPQLAGLEDTWNRIEDGSPALDRARVRAHVRHVRRLRGDVPRRLRRRPATRIGWNESYLITMAGLAASRIFAAGGAGGLVLQAWALRQAGMRKRIVADKTISFLVLTYFPYAAAVIICGFGLRIGIFPGEAPFTMTVIPADDRA